MIVKKRKHRTKTPVSTITNMLRRIWVYSPERRNAMKLSNSLCDECGDLCARSKKEQEEKGGKRLEIHHCEPVEMTELAKLIHKRLFGCELTALCEECHVKITKIERYDK